MWETRFPLRRILRLRSSEMRGGVQWWPVNDVSEERTGHTFKYRVVPYNINIRAEQKIWEVRFHSNGITTKSRNIETTEKEGQRK